ncbi:MAG: MBL fold metallo-hydrolase [Proteobacteria bacterium]|nr:MAG: MBL fold metallo-hydrolase [Pseudomonadota bacterium]
MMIRFGRFFGSVVLASALVVQAMALAGDDLPDVEMQPIRVSEHVWYVSGTAGVATDNAGFVSNAAFVVTADGVVVFDTLGTPALARMLVERIRDVTGQPVRRVYISHYHADHVYGAQIFEDLGASIVAPEGAIRYLEGRAAGERLAERRVSLAPWVDDETRIVEPHRLLSGEERFNLGGVAFRAVNLGSAHSEGDLVLFVETDRVLVSGDIIFEGRIPFLGSANSGKWLETLVELETLDVAAIVPGHGAAASDPGKLVSLTRDYLAYVREKMSTAVDDWVPFDEAYDGVDWSDFIEYPAFFEANRRNAYGVYLSLEREALE